MGWKLIELRCTRCQHEWDFLRKDEEAYEVCPECGEASEYKFSAPKVLKAAFLDGTVRPDVRAAAESSALKSAAFDQPPAERGRILREADKIKKQGGKKT